MGHHGGSKPDGLTAAQLKTLFLRAPYSDFASLSQGYKQEFRAQRLGAVVPDTPTPVVLYAVSSGGHKRSCLMVLTGYREERLFYIAEDVEGLEREGVADYDAFKRYWRARTRRAYDPMCKVGVFRLARLQESDRLKLGMVLFDRLYGAYDRATRG